MMFYHGSFDYIEPGTVLTPRPDYESNWSHTDFYNELERYRPPHMIAHANGVFMCSDIDDVELTGGSTEWLFTVMPIGPVQKHDLNWSSAMSCAVDLGCSKSLKEKIAYLYWHGIPNFGESVMEYITPAATIIKVEPYAEAGFDLAEPSDKHPTFK